MFNPPGIRQRKRSSKARQRSETLARNGLSAPACTLREMVRKPQRSLHRTITHLDHILHLRPRRRITRWSSLPILPLLPRSSDSPNYNQLLGLISRPSNYSRIEHARAPSSRNSNPTQLSPRSGERYRNRKSNRTSCAILSTRALQDCGPSGYTAYVQWGNAVF